MGKVHYSLPQASFHRANHWYKVMARVLSLDGSLLTDLQSKSWLDALALFNKLLFQGLHLQTALPPLRNWQAQYLIMSHTDMFNVALHKFIWTMEISSWVRQNHQGLTMIPPNLLHQLMPMLLETMMTMACPSYGALITLWIMLIELGNSSGGLIMFGSLYLMRRRVVKRKRRSKNLATKKTVRIVLSRMMNM